jgi:hypothetical protein
MNVEEVPKTCGLSSKVEQQMRETIVFSTRWSAQGQAAQHRYIRPKKASADVVSMKIGLLASCAE